MLEIDRGKCDGCGLCIEVCSCRLLVLVNNVVEVKDRIGCPPFEVITEE